MMLVDTTSLNEEDELPFTQENAEILRPCFQKHPISLHLQGVDRSPGIRFDQTVWSAEFVQVDVFWYGKWPRQRISSWPL